MVLVLVMALGLISCGDEKKISALTIVDTTLTKEYTVGDTPDFSGLAKEIIKENYDLKEPKCLRYKYTQI